jgi:hypothetical protein
VDRKVLFRESILGSTRGSTSLQIQKLVKGKMSLPNILTTSVLEEFSRIINKLHMVYIPDKFKVFDVVKVIEELERQHISKKSRILDMGTYQSGILWALHALEYENLYGIDLNPGIYGMPFNNEIHYRV